MRAILYLSLIFSGLFSNIPTKNSAELSFKGMSGNKTSNALAFPQPFAGCDEMGRILPDNEATGNLKSNRQLTDIPNNPNQQ